MQWAASLIAPRPGERILEVGSGHGVLVGLLAAADAVVTGLDRSATMTATAEKSNADGANLLTGRVQDLDPGLGPFDTVIAMRVREMWTDPESLPAIRRVLAPGGRIVLILDSPAGPVRPETVDTVTSTLAANGFAQIRIQAEGPLTGIIATAE